MTEKMEITKKIGVLLAAFKKAALIK